MVVVLGGGLVGLGVAYELKKRGAEVRLIESRAVGRAASWAGAGMLAPFTEAIDSGPFADFCAESLARYPSYVAELRECGGVDAQLRLNGILEVAYDPADVVRLRAQVATFEKRGIAARYLESSEARSLEPALGDAILGASLSSSEGAVDNRRLGRALHAACVAAGVRVDVEAGDVALEADARRVLGVRTAAGFVPADLVVNATGAWAAELSGVPLAERVPVVPIKGQMLALAMPRAFVRRVVWAPGVYLVPRDDGRLLVGATVERAGFDRRITAGGVLGLLAAATTAMPALADLSVAETWAGLTARYGGRITVSSGGPELAGYLLSDGPLPERHSADARRRAVAHGRRRSKVAADPILVAFSPLRSTRSACERSRRVATVNATVNGAPREVAERRDARQPCCANSASMRRAASRSPSMPASCGAARSRNTVCRTVTRVEIIRAVSGG